MTRHELIARFQKEFLIDLATASKCANIAQEYARELIPSEQDIVNAHQNDWPLRNEWKYGARWMRREMISKINKP